MPGLAGRGRGGRGREWRGSLQGQCSGEELNERQRQGKCSGEGGEERWHITRLATYFNFGSPARAMLRKEERRGELARSLPSRRTRAPLGRASSCWSEVVLVRGSGSRGRGECNPSGRDIVAPQRTQREQSRARALRRGLLKQPYFPLFYFPPTCFKETLMQCGINLHSSSPASLGEQHLFQWSQQGGSNLKPLLRNGSDYRSQKLI